MNKFDEFLKLHHSAEPLLIGNAWNTQSAKVLESKKFKALATSSAAVAETIGYKDEQEMPVDDYLFVAKRILATTSLPLSVDFEAGYGHTAEEIYQNLKRLAEAGVSGVNLEDTIVKDGKRTISEPKEFALKIRKIVELLNKNGIKLFLNLRSDSFLLGLDNPLQDALKRIEAYHETGAHGIFLPCITDINHIREATSKSKLPINVMCMPNLPDFNQLKDAGVKRISIGPFLYRKAYREMESAVDTMLANGNFSNLF